MRTLLALPLTALTLWLTSVAPVVTRRVDPSPGFDVIETFTCGTFGSTGQVRVIHETTTQDATWSHTTVELRAFGDAPGAVSLAEDELAELETMVRTAAESQRGWAIDARTSTRYEYRGGGGLVLTTPVAPGKPLDSFVTLAPGAVVYAVKLDDLLAGLANARERIVELR